jgi:hypothetical protein
MSQLRSQLLAPVADPATGGTTAAFLGELIRTLKYKDHLISLAAEDTEVEGRMENIEELMKLAADTDESGLLLSINRVGHFIDVWRLFYIIEFAHFQC